MKLERCSAGVTESRTDIAGEFWIGGYMNKDASFYRNLVELSNIAVVVVGPDAIIRYHSREAARMLTGEDADLVSTLLHTLFTPDTQGKVDGWLRQVLAQTADVRPAVAATRAAAAVGDERFVELTGVNLVGTSSVDGIVLTLVDSTELRRALAHAERLARVDALTDLPNRAALDEHGRALFAKGSSRQVVLAMIDVDNLKTLNDNHGHAAGDEALRAVARHLSVALGDTGVVARVGGDEFAALLFDVAPSEGLAILRGACTSVDLRAAGVDQGLTLSCGVASSTAATDWLGLLRRADAAVYEAKLSGKDRIHFSRDDEPNWEERRKREVEALEEAGKKVAALESDVVRLHHETRLDKRTGLLNAAAFEHDLHELHQHSVERDEPYAIVLCDIDFFHRYNKRYLYEPANETLRRVADALKGACRTGDVVYRYGGEEMIVLLPRTRLAAAGDVGERLRFCVADLRIPHENRPEPQIVTVSVGVAQCHPGDGTTSRQIIDAANRALLVAKESGRNRVEVGAYDAARS